MWHKLAYKKLCLNTEKHFFAMRLFNHLNRLPRDIVVSIHVDIKGLMGNDPQQL